MRGSGLTMLALGSLAVVAGCGGSGFPPAAEPADSPAVSHRPAGRTIAVGAQPEGVVVDPRTGLAATITRNPSSLALVDLAGRRVVGRAPLPAAGRHLALAGRGGPVLVPVTKRDELVEVELPSGRERAVTVGHHPHDLASAADRIFVGDESSSRLSVVSGRQDVADLPTPQQPGGVAAASGRVAVVAVAARVLEAYDAATLKPLGRAGAGVGPTHIVAAGSRAWVADTDGGAVLTFALAPRPRLLSTVPAPGAPYGLAIDGRRRRLWVTLTARNELLAFDVSGPRPRQIASYPTLAQPNTVAADPHTGAAVVAVRDAGRLELIPPPRR
jgi:DNA-binding beta-propeller fold protein YncE